MDRMHSYVWDLYIPNWNPSIFLKIESSLLLNRIQPETSDNTLCVGHIYQVRTNRIRTHACVLVCSLYYKPSVKHNINTNLESKDPSKDRELLAAEGVPSLSLSLSLYIYIYIYIEYIHKYNIKYIPTWNPSICPKTESFLPPKVYSLSLSFSLFPLLFLFLPPSDGYISRSTGYLSTWNPSIFPKTESSLPPKV